MRTSNCGSYCPAVRYGMLLILAAVSFSCSSVESRPNRASTSRADLNSVPRRKSTSPTNVTSPVFSTPTTSPPAAASTSVGVGPVTANLTDCEGLVKDGDLAAIGLREHSLRLDDNSDQGQQGSPDCQSGDVFDPPWLKLAANITDQKTMDDVRRAYSLARQWSAGCWPSRTRPTHG